jgi:arsenate reductase (thioredoxin)
VPIIIQEAESMTKVAFICTHNSCRSQIAQALGRKLAFDVFESYSGGTEIKEAINPDAIRLMKTMYGIDMEKEQKPKHLRELPPMDVVITMGCGAACPYLPSKHTEDWGLDDPTGKSDADFKETIIRITAKMLDLKARIQNESIFNNTFF